MSEISLVQKQTVAVEPWEVMKEKATMLVKTGFLPAAIKTPEQAMAIMLTGQELGIPPMQSLRGINVIQGVPVIKPEMMLALCIGRIPGFTYKFEHSDNTSATFVCSRPALKEPYVSTFTMADAKAAGLAGKDNWQKWAGNMLRWRAAGNALHVVAPDVLVGVYTPDEMGAITNAEGEAVEAPITVRDTLPEATDAEITQDEQPTLADPTFAGKLQHICILCDSKLKPDADPYREINRILKANHIEAAITSRKDLTVDEANIVIKVLEGRADYVPPATTDTPVPMADATDKMKLIGLYERKTGEKRKSTDFDKTTHAEALELITAMTDQPDYEGGGLD
jgi:hypothetical protein